MRFKAAICSLAAVAALALLFSFLRHSDKTHAALRYSRCRLPGPNSEQTSISRISSRRRRNLAKPFSAGPQARARGPLDGFPRVSEGRRESFGTAEEVMFAQRQPIWREQPGKVDSKSVPACVSEISLSMQCSGVGIASFLLYAVQQVAICHRLSLPVLVRWTACQSHCGPPTGFNYRTWWFKDAPGPTINEKYLNKHGAICLGDQPFRFQIATLADFTFKEPRYGLNFPTLYEGYITPDVRRGVNKLLQRYFRPHDYIREAVDRFVSKNFRGQTVVGVHVRATDHGSETYGHRVPSVTNWVTTAQRLLISLGLTRKSTSTNFTIFVASDNMEALKVFKEEFPGLVCHTNIKRTKKFSTKSWLTGFNSKFAENEWRGAGVLIDALLLSRSDYMIHGESSVAALAAYYNPKLRLIFQSSSARTAGMIHQLRKKLSSDQSASNKRNSLDQLRSRPLAGDNLQTLQTTALRTKISRRLPSKPMPKAAWYKALREGMWTDILFMKASCLAKNARFSVCSAMRRREVESAAKLLSGACRTCPERVTELLADAAGSSERFFATMPD